MGNVKSTQNILNNGLPEGSVLAPTLFNLDISDIPATSHKFGHRDDWAIAIREKLIENTERTLTEDQLNLWNMFGFVDLNRVQIKQRFAAST